MVLGLYVLLMSVSGTVLVYHNELAQELSRQTKFVSASGTRMRLEELKKAASNEHPGYEVTLVVMRNQDQPVEIWLERHGSRMGRLFDPYTGADMGNALRPSFRFVEWLVDLHGDLLAGRTGRVINAVGGFLVIVLCLSGAGILWSGRDEWWGLATGRRKGPKRLRIIHRTLGFWFFAFVLIWGLSGIYLAIPNTFHAIVDLFSPASDLNEGSRFGDYFLLWLSELHFGRFAGLPVEIVWSVLGLTPVILFVTGSLMWWNRVLKPWLGTRSGKP
jgi:uncharacterized iron-regulated membrane protein